MEQLQNYIAEDGGALSINFDFTEWSHKIKYLKNSGLAKRRWLVANSSHVIDLAFHLGGKPKIGNVGTQAA